MQTFSYSSTFDNRARLCLSELQWHYSSNQAKLEFIDGKISCINFAANFQAIGGRQLFEVNGGHLIFEVYDLT